VCSEVKRRNRKKDASGERVGTLPKKKWLRSQGRGNFRNASETKKEEKTRRKVMEVHPRMGSTGEKKA